MAGQSVNYWLDRVERQLQEDGLTPWSIRRYLQVARHFLLYLQGRKRTIRAVTPSDLQLYLRGQWCRFKRDCGRPPRDPTSWRTKYTGVIHRLLRLAQGEWPPPSQDESLLSEFTDHLAARGLSADMVRSYRLHAGFFLEYLSNRRLQVEKVSPAHVQAYLRAALRISRSRRPGFTRSVRSWHGTTRRAVYGVLRFVQGEWPPCSPLHPACLRFREYLEEAGYGKEAVHRRVGVIQQFLAHLNERSTPLSAAGPRETADFLRTRLARYQRRYGHLPLNLPWWRRNYTGAIHSFLQLTNPD